MRNFGIATRSANENNPPEGVSTLRLLETTPVDGRDTPVPLFTGGFSFARLAPDNGGGDHDPYQTNHYDPLDHVKIQSDEREFAALVFAFTCFVSPVLLAGTFIFGWLLFFE